MLKYVKLSLRAHLSILRVNKFQQNNVFFFQISARPNCKYAFYIVRNIFLISCCHNNNRTRALVKLSIMLRDCSRLLFEYIFYQCGRAAVFFSEKASNTAKTILQKKQYYKKTLKFYSSCTSNCRLLCEAVILCQLEMILCQINKV